MTTATERIPESVIDFMKECAAGITELRAAHNREIAAFMERIRELRATIRDYDELLRHVVSLDDERVTLATIVENIGTACDLTEWRVCGLCNDADCMANSGEQGAECMHGIVTK